MLSSAQRCVWPAASAWSIAVDHGAKALEVGGGRPSGRGARGDDLEALEQREHLDDRLARDRRDRRADVRDADDQPFGLQQPQRFAHRDDADLEAPREVVDDQPLARRQLALRNRVAQRVVDKLLLGQVALAAPAV